MNWVITNAHIAVERMNWMIVDAISHDGVFITPMQTVTSSSWTIDTVRQSFVKEGSTLVGAYLCHTLDRCKCHSW